MGLRIQLLGSPKIERDGVSVDAPRGFKTWGLLTYLVRTRVPSSRERLANLLFPEAGDPLGSLRWTLSVLRRQLGEHAELGGDPVRLTLSPGTFLDLDVLGRGSWVQAIALPGLGHDLLEAALALLARGDAVAAAHHASVLVGLNPLDENAHVLFVRCLRASGDTKAAKRQVEACVELFNRELDIDPSPALRSAAATSGLPIRGHVPGRAVVLAQIEAGEAAISAGAIEAGLHSLRSAAAAAREGNDHK